MRKLFDVDMSLVHLLSNTCSIFLLVGILGKSTHDVRNVLKPTTKASVLHSLVLEKSEQGEYVQEV